MRLIYKICPASAWREAERRGVFQGSHDDVRDGFIHPYELRGTPARAEIRAIIRDFDESLMLEHSQLLRSIATGNVTRLV